MLIINPTQANVVTLFSNPESKHSCIQKANLHNIKNNHKRNFTYFKPGTFDKSLIPNKKVGLIQIRILEFEADKDTLDLPAQHEQNKP